MFLRFFFSTKCNLAKYLQTNWKFGTSRREQKLIIVNQIFIGNRFSKINMTNSICYCQLSFYISPSIVQQAQPFYTLMVSIPDEDWVRNLHHFFRTTDYNFSSNLLFLSSKIKISWMILSRQDGEIFGNLACRKSIVWGLIIDLRMT